MNRNNNFYKIKGKGKIPYFLKQSSLLSNASKRVGVKKSVIQKQRIIKDLEHLILLHQVIN